MLSTNRYLLTLENVQYYNTHFPSMPLSLLPPLSTSLSISL
jgi:hypothetical protein